MEASQAEYVIFDVETTGLFPKKGDRIVEIAAIKIKGEEIVDSMTSLINPEREIPMESQRVHNISPEMLVDAPIAADILPDFIPFIAGSCLVGHNIKFDLDFLCYELASIGRKLNDVTPALDTLKMARKTLPHLNSFRLTNVALSLGAQVDETHRALADVKLTVAIFKRLIQLANKQGIKSFKDFHRDFGIVKPNFKLVEIEQGFLF